METESIAQRSIGVRTRVAAALAVVSTTLAGCSDIGHKSPHETSPTTTTITQAAPPPLDCPQWTAHPEAKKQLDDRLGKIVSTYIVAPNATVARKGGDTGQFTPGVTLAVGCGNQTLASFGAGSLTYETQQLPSPDATEYDLSSVSKSLTAGAVFMLVQQGKLHLDDAVGVYLPQYTIGLKQQVTIRMLLEHRSGLKDSKYNVVAYGNETSAEVEQNILNYPLTYQPGKNYRYSNFGFDTLYWAASKAAGVPLEQYIQTNILMPLGMTNTAHFNTDSDPVVKNCAPTSPDDDENAEIDCLPQDSLADYLDNIAGHAGWFSSATSWSKYAEMMANGGVLDGHTYFTPATMKLMETAQLEHDYSLGTITNSRHFFSMLMSKAAVGHTGHNGPEWCADPKTKLWVVMLANGTYHAGAPSAKGTNAFNRLATVVAQANNAL